MVRKQGHALVVVSAASQDGRVAARPFLPKEFKEPYNGLLLSPAMMNHPLSHCPDPSPAPRQARISKQVRLDRYRIEAGDVFRLGGPLEVKMVALDDHAQIIAFPETHVQRVF